MPAVFGEFDKIDSVHMSYNILMQAPVICGPNIQMGIAAAADQIFSVRRKGEAKYAISNALLLYGYTSMCFK